MTDKCMEEELRCGYTVTTEKKKLWMILLDLSKELKRVCQKYQLSYFLHAGSLLGAVRHQGFIPWDDDMDFVMPRADFERLIAVSEAEFQEPYCLQTLGNTTDTVNYGRAVLRNGNTTGVQLLRDLYNKDHNGIGIDISALDVAISQPWLRKMWWKKTDRYAAMLYLKGIGSCASQIPALGWGKGKTAFYKGISRYFSRDHLAERLEKNNKRYLNRKTGEWTINHELFGQHRHLIFKSRYYESFREMPFEGILFPVPAGYDEILSQYYAPDYMDFPEEKERKGHHYRILNLEESYREYLPHFQDIFKNTEGKRIVIFGAGKMTEHYLDNVEESFLPEWIVDNDKNKWGKKVKGIRVENPESLKKVDKSEQYVVICSIYYKEIEKQLKKLGISNYYIYVQNADWL